MTIEELDALLDTVYSESARKELRERSKTAQEYWDTIHQFKAEAFKRYAEESDDELLKKALLSEEIIPWGKDKVIEFIIDSEKLVFNDETKTITGPRQMIDEVKEANERWRGIRDPKANSDSYSNREMYVAPGDLWNYRALVPLIYRLYGETKKITWEVTEKYPRNPVADLEEKLGWTTSVCD